jgi:hypothetical protein
MGHEISVTLQSALSQFAESLARFLPRLLAALAILVLGWLLSATLRGVTRRVLSWIRFDQLVDRIGVGAVIRKLIGKPPHMAMGSAVYWLSWIAILLAALQALGVSGTEALVQDFVRFLPRLAAAVLILLVGLLVSTLAWRASLLAAVGAGMHAAKLLGTMARFLVMVATVTMALEQIDVGRGVMHTAFAIAFGGIVLAMAIAFGLGGRHAARRFLEEKLLARDLEKDDERASHL